MQKKLRKLSRQKNFFCSRDEKVQHQLQTKAQKITKVERNIGFKQQQDAIKNTFVMFMARKNILCKTTNTKK